VSTSAYGAGTVCADAGVGQDPKTIVTTTRRDENQ
jgi:hypothetical protein